MDRDQVLARTRELAAVPPRFPDIMAVMKTRFLAATLTACSLTWLVAQPFQAALAAATDHADCSHLLTLKLPDVKVTEAVATPSGNGMVKVAHCRVTGVIAKEIHFSLLLPDEWNHKFMMGGGGGFVGNVQNQAQASVNAGYATAGTDTGHEASGTVASWAQNDLERQINFGYLAVHRTTEVAKAIVRSYYGATETRSYFSGCSNGGRQALMEAQRYPDDFDGIVAGAPAYDFTGIGAQFIKDMQAAFPDPRNVSAPLFAAETLTSIEAQIVARCDTLDGVKDGLLEDPRQCKADVSSLTRSSTWKAAASLEAVRAQKCRASASRATVTRRKAKATVRCARSIPPQAT